MKNITIFLLGGLFALSLLIPNGKMNIPLVIVGVGIGVLIGNWLIKKEKNRCK